MTRLDIGRFIIPECTQRHRKAKRQPLTVEESDRVVRLTRIQALRRVVGRCHERNRHGLAASKLQEYYPIHKLLAERSQNNLRRKTGSLRAFGWRQEELAKASGIGTATIQRIEKSDGPIGGYVSTLMRIQSAFEQAGVRFLDNDAGGGIGVRLAAPKP
jgi:Helix-turn-helix